MRRRPHRPRASARASCRGASTVASEPAGEAEEVAQQDLVSKARQVSGPSTEMEDRTSTRFT